MPYKPTGFDYVPCGLAVVAPNGRLLWVNALFAEICGITSGTVDQYQFQQLLSAAGAIFYETQFLPVLLLQGFLKEVAIDIKTRSGARIPVLLNAKLSKGASGEPSEIHIALFEATERHRYEHDLLAMLKAAEQMAEVVHRSSDAIIAVAPDGVVRSWNIGAEQMLGYVSSNAVGKPLFELLFPQLAATDVETMILSLSQGHEVGRELVVYRNDGRQLDVSIKLTPHLEPPGTLVAFFAIIRDETLRRLAEKALIQNEKLASVGRLASSIAHEINNPLESVTNLVYLVCLQAESPTMKSLLEQAQDELKRVSHVVIHTLRFHRQSSKPSEISIPSLLQSVLSLYKGRLLHSGISVIIERSEPSTLVGYEGELRQILTNLIANAFDSMRNGGRLLLRYRRARCREQAGMQIIVADTGVGMDEGTRARVFEPFFTTKGIVATGLGLWVVKDLVDKAQGTIRVRSSRRQGKSGTVVALCLPALEGQEKARSTAQR